MLFFKKRKIELNHLIYNPNLICLWAYRNNFFFDRKQIKSTQVVLDKEDYF